MTEAILLCVCVCAGPVLGMCNMCNRTGPRTLGAPRFHDFNLQVYCVNSSTACVPVSTKLPSVRMARRL